VVVSEVTAAKVIRERLAALSPNDPCRIALTAQAGRKYVIVEALRAESMRYSVLDSQKKTLSISLLLRALRLKLDDSVTRTDDVTLEVKRPMYVAYKKLAILDLTRGAWTDVKFSFADAAAVKKGLKDLSPPAGSPPTPNRRSR
jgi:hypothetical protein